jgi:hypothetical protein
MKILVDKLPQTKDECLFCVEGNGGCHRCLFHMGAYDYHGLTTNYYDCYLTTGRECPYLKETNNENLGR